VLATGRLVNALDRDLGAEKCVSLDTARSITQRDLDKQGLSRWRITVRSVAHAGPLASCTTGQVLRLGTVQLLLVPKAPPRPITPLPTTTT
jgi:hypothetical protein